VTKTPFARPRGTGRTAFIGRLDAIRADIAEGEFLVAIYAKHQAALGITYSAFRKLVQRYAEDPSHANGPPTAPPGRLSHPPPWAHPLPRPP
jgi:hypothetical protein